MPFFFFSFSSFLLSLASSLEMAPSATAMMEKRFPFFCLAFRALTTTSMS